MAVESYKSSKEQIDLIIIDAVMPKLGGSDALFEIRKMNPEVRSLFISGYGKQQHDVDDTGSVADLIKPFEIGVFSHLIHERLHEVKPLSDNL